MPGLFTQYLRNSILNHVFKNSAFSQPTNIYIGLSPTGTFTEPAGNNYARALANTWAVASTGAVANTVDIVFNQAGGSWGTITQYRIFDDVSAGNVLASGSLPIAKTVTQGDTLQFPSGGLIVNTN